MHAPSVSSAWRWPPWPASLPPTCAFGAREIDRPVRFSGLNWESNLVMVGIQRFILEKGLASQTAMEIGETLPMLATACSGDVDVAEVWPGQIEGALEKAPASGKGAGRRPCVHGGRRLVRCAIPSNATPTSGGPPTCNATKSTFTDPEDPAKAASTDVRRD